MIFKLDICAGVIFSFIITQFIFRFSYNFAHWILEVTNTCLESRLFFSGIWYFLLGTTAFLIIESSHYHILLLVFLIKLFLIRSHSMAVDVFYSSLIISATEYILKSLPDFFWDISPLAQSCKLPSENGYSNSKYDESNSKVGIVSSCQSIWIKLFSCYLRCGNWFLTNIGSSHSWWCLHIFDHISNLLSVPWILCNIRVDWLFSQDSLISIIRLSIVRPFLL